jgi:phospholipid/cholesterol/gamma-HCH transport system substrate-binding protein
VADESPLDVRAEARLRLMASFFIALMLLLVLGTAAYLLYARGAFESTQELVLLADDSEGVKVGMDLTFSGFPIGRVRRIELNDDGSARIRLDLPRRQAHWLRQSSVFTLARGVLGSTNIRAYTGIPSDPPLSEGAERKLLVGDATAEIPQLVSAARELVQNLTAMTASDSSLNASLGNLRGFTQKLNGHRGALAAAFGNDRDAEKVVEVLDRTNALLGRIAEMTGHADAQMFGQDGVTANSRRTLEQLNGLLGEARDSLKKVDAVLDQALGAAANLREASKDLAPLRAQVDASLSKIESLTDEVNRKWPFRRDIEIKLP